MIKWDLSEMQKIVEHAHTYVYTKINTICHVNKMKVKNYMSISIDYFSSYDKIQHNFHDKNTTDWT